MDNANISDLFEILVCPCCRDSSTLTIQSPGADQALKWKQDLNESHEISRSILCNGCQRTFPITHDGIPVMWSDTLQSTFRTLSDDIDDSSPDERDVKAANIHVYETIVDDYDKAGVHFDDVTQQRMLGALTNTAQQLSGWHVDVGCGGGNILQMTDKLNLDPKVGVDISLSALRVVHRKGYFAVLGDAENLPFKSSAVGLVTASSVLHHLFAPERLIGEANRILKNDGLFLTDFDPNKRAADWGVAARVLYQLRLPVYLALSKWRPGKVGHSSRIVQTWNKIAEFHNHPGAGFEPEELTDDLKRSGFDVVMLFRHNTKDGDVNPTIFSRPNLRSAVTQILSFRNPFLRTNADTLLTLSRKPASRSQHERPTLRATA